MCQVETSRLTFIIEEKFLETIGDARGTKPPVAVDFQARVNREVYRVRTTQSQMGSDVGGQPANQVCKIAIDAAGSLHEVDVSIIEHLHCLFRSRITVRTSLDFAFLICH